LLLRLHFDSSKLSFTGFEEAVPSPRPIAYEVLSDLENWDLDGSTDQFVNILWAEDSPSSGFPNRMLPHELLRPKFRVTSFGPVSDTQVYFSGVSAATHELVVQPTKIDIEAAVPGGVVGRTVRVRRALDPDLSGTGGQGNADEDDALSLAEVQIYTATPSTDQRGFSRPLGEAADIGALESGHPTCNNGDLNGDSRVDRIDAAIMARNFGRTTSACIQGDLDANGRVDVADLARIQASLFAASGPSPSAPSPAASIVDVVVRDDYDSIRATRRVIDRRVLIGNAPDSPATRLRAERARAISKAASRIDATFAIPQESLLIAPDTRVRRR
jgi:hypothetical protein